LAESVCAGISLESRLWTLTDGRMVTGVYAGVTRSVVSIQPAAGPRIAVWFPRLSAGDQAYIRRVASDAERAALDADPAAASQAAPDAVARRRRQLSERWDALRRAGYIPSDG